jgi:RNA polymerase sigma-70 factor, ECF subfamily
MYSQVIELRSDRQILAGLLERDPRAIDAAWDRHRSAVFRVAHRILRDRATAEDVSQEVFCALWERPEQVDLSRGTLGAFLAKLTHFRAVDAVRNEDARRRREERVNLSHMRLSPGTDGDLVAEKVADADGGLAGAIRHALARLPERQRTAVELAYFAGYTYREVGAILSIPEGTAKSRLRAGLATLGRSLSTTAVSQGEPRALGPWVGDGGRRVTASARHLETSITAC